VRPVRLSILAVGLACAPAFAADPAPLSVRLANAVMARWPDPLTIAPEKGFEYNTAIILYGMAQVHRAHPDPRYVAYARRWVDHYLQPDGSVDLGDDAAGHNFDRIQPGLVVLFLYEETKDERYAKAARFLRARFDTMPRNSVGGFWHKTKYPDEMWLDGLYMGEPFLARYGRLFGESGFPQQTAVQQATLMAKHTRAPGASGLLRHAWDADRNAAWADPQTGLSPEVWGRAMGWYLMALADVLDELPAAHPDRAKLLALLREGARAVRAFQDAKTGLWFQVLDKPAVPENWVETSGSGMIAYALARGAARGYLAADYAAVARRGLAGLTATLSEDSRGPVVTGAVEGMGAQKDLASYLNKKRLENSPHGLCAVLLAATAVEALPPVRR